MLLTLSGCGLSNSNHDPKSVFDDPNVYEVSSGFIEALLTKDTEAFRLGIFPDPEIGPIGDEVFEEFYSYLPGTGKATAELFYAERRRAEFEGEMIPVYLTIYDIYKDGEFAQITLAVAPVEGECCSATYWHIIETDSLPSQTHELTFSGKGTLHYVMFGLLLGVPAFIIFTCVHCLRLERLEGRWLWFIFILVGVWGLEFNWTTGTLNAELLSVTPQGVTINFLRFHFLGAGIYAVGVFQPWILQVGTPLGAIVYWFALRHARSEGEQI